MFEAKTKVTSAVTPERIRKWLADREAHPIAVLSFFVSRLASDEYLIRQSSKYNWLFILLRCVLAGTVRIPSVDELKHRSPDLLDQISKARDGADAALTSLMSALNEYARLVMLSVATTSGWEHVERTVTSSESNATTTPRGRT